MPSRSVAVATSTALVGAGIVAVTLSRGLNVRSVSAADLPEVIHLGGLVRDFPSSHVDFDITDLSAMGHHAFNVDHALGGDNRPVYTGGGQRVTSPWYDKNANPIAAYAVDGGPGLPGGHFDVDVFDEATTKELYHEHQFDDKFDVTYVDIAGDPKLLFDSVIGPGYPNDLRVTFLNPHHGSGRFKFKANGPMQSGRTRDGFETTFSPADLAQFRIDFAFLNDLCHTSPGRVQGDVVDRDDAFSVQMFDTVTDQLVYELSVYHHGDGPVEQDPPPVYDACGAQVTDTPGTFGDSGGGAVNSADSFGQWFRDVLGSNASVSHKIALQHTGGGIYEYMTDSFFPVDDRALGNEGDTHNNFFTYSITAAFTYRACTGQFFEFEGNDDSWVFIDDRAVIDNGGVATDYRQYIDLDRLHLVDGQVYEMRFFYAHRRKMPDSVFNMRTNILFENRMPTASGGYD